MQVCPHRLHITLGIFICIFVLLDDTCHQLDLSASLQGSDCGPSYERYAQVLCEQRSLKDKVHCLQGGLAVLEQILTFTAATSADNPSNPLFLSLATEVADTKETRNVSVHINSI